MDNKDIRSTNDPIKPGNGIAKCQDAPIGTRKVFASFLWFCLQMQGVEMKGRISRLALPTLTKTLTIEKSFFSIAKLVNYFQCNNYKTHMKCIFLIVLTGMYQVVFLLPINVSK